VTQEYAYGMWIIAAFNVGLFLFFFLSFLPPKGRLEWRNLGIVTAFLVALFSEMYGFPLTIYLLTGWLGDAYPVLEPFNHKFGHLWVVVFGGSNLAWALVMAASLVLMISGYVLLSKGWRQVHGGKGRMITDGLYGYVRHPQYTGLFLVILGFLVQWPTLLTVLMAPVLVYAYVRLAYSEEHHMLDRFGDQYREYARRVPAFIPPFDRWKDFLMAEVPESDSQQGFK
jgi:protein-S-isoprenylcysteine O-methyltransferase Ste14